MHLTTAVRRWLYQQARHRYLCKLMIVVRSVKRIGMLTLPYSDVEAFQEKVSRKLFLLVPMQVPASRGIAAIFGRRHRHLEGESTDHPTSSRSVTSRPKNGYLCTPCQGNLKMRRTANSRTLIVCEGKLKLAFLSISRFYI